MMRGRDQSIMTQRRIGIVVGSARRASFSMAVAKAVVGTLPETMTAQIIPIGELPMFCQDFDDDGATPESWTAFRRDVADMDGFIFVTPEYNRSCPPLLKNALDIASRPAGQNLWSGKPGAVIGVSPGRLGGFGACHHLRQVLAFLGVYTMTQPEAYLSEIEAALDPQGQVTDTRTLSFLQGVTDAFAEWVARVAN